VCEGFIVDELITRGSDENIVLGSARTKVRRLAVRTRRRKCKGGYAEFAHRLSELPVSNRLSLRIRNLSRLYVDNE